MRSLTKGPRALRPFSTAVVYGVALAVGAFIGVGCGASSPTQNQDNHSGIEIEQVSGSYFRLLRSDASNCPDELDEREGKLNPSLDQLESILGDEPDVFVVLMEEEIDNNEFPMPEPSRNEEAREFTQERRARAQSIASSQGCAISSVAVVGGTYERSFLLINAFTATLTPAQANLISQRADVRYVELSNTGTPPPTTF